MNNALTFGKVLSGLSKTLRVANEVIPLYRETKPLFKNAKTIYNLFKSPKEERVNSKIVIKSNLKNQKKEIITSNNNPQFFI